jgi:hypothetical protein
MAEKKKPAKKPAPPASDKQPAASPPKPKKAAPPVFPRSLSPVLAKKIPPAFSRMAADDRAPSGKGGKGGKGDDGNVKNLSKQQVDAIRLLAITMAGPELAEDAVLICNPVGEPAALPLSELLYDNCKWCNVEIYYDRLMPSRPDLMRVCLKCGILLLEAEKKGAN